MPLGVLAPTEMPRDVDVIIGGQKTANAEDEKTKKSKESGV